MRNIFFLFFVLLVVAGCAPAVDKGSVAGEQASEVLTDVPAVVKPVETAVPGDGELGGVKEVQVVATKFRFTPDTIRVRQGDTIRLIITSREGSHGLSLPEYGLNVEVAEGETKTLEFVADKSGTFSMMCSVFCGSGHREMKGTLMVE